MNNDYFKYYAKTPFSGLEKDEVKGKVDRMSKLIKEAEEENAKQVDIEAKPYQRKDGSFLNLHEFTDELIDEYEKSYHRMKLNNRDRRFFEQVFLFFLFSTKIELRKSGI